LRPVHIYWFAYYNTDSPSTRYRGRYVLQHLKAAHGVSYDLVVPGYGWRNVLHFVRVYAEALLFRKRNSWIVFQKIHSNGWYTRALLTLLSVRRRRTLYDTDDAEHLRFSTEVMHRFMKRCSACAVGSEALAVYVQRYNPDVFLLTSPVIDHVNTKRERNAVFTIGWVGGYNTNKESSEAFAHKKSVEETLLPALRDLKFNVRFVMLGVTEQSDRDSLARYFEKSRVELDVPATIDWQDEDWVYRQIARFDVGVSPMVNHEFNRAKSAFKLKQYMSCGVPVLASAVGENKRFIAEGFNGFLCNTPDDYREKLCYLHELSDDRYAQISANAKTSSQAFNMTAHGEELLKQIATRSRH
jgi:glycosyltransferase involved in cell wall biosynthesis